MKNVDELNNQEWETTIQANLRHNGEITMISWAREGKFIVTGGLDQFIKLWNFNTQELVI